MSVLPSPVARRSIHTRRIAFEGFLRDDGLWDIDCMLEDTKSVPVHLHERGGLAPGTPIHQLRVRLRVDDSLTIRAVETAAQAVPFSECQQATGEPMQRLVSLRWREARFVGPDLGRFAWRQFVLPVQLPPGQHVLVSRAQDTQFNWQVETSPENSGGYLNSDWRSHALTITVV